MQRTFTKRIACKACQDFFTITSAASKFCKNSWCVSKRRKADRMARKPLPPAVVVGTDDHLARALRSGE